MASASRPEALDLQCEPVVAEIAHQRAALVGHWRADLTGVVGKVEEHVRTGSGTHGVGLPGPRPDRSRVAGRDAGVRGPRRVRCHFAGSVDPAKCVRGLRSGVVGPGRRANSITGSADGAEPSRRCRGWRSLAPSGSQQGGTAPTQSQQCHPAAHWPGHACAHRRGRRLGRHCCCAAMGVVAVVPDPIAARGRASRGRRTAVARTIPAGWPRAGVPGGSRSRTDRWGGGRACRRSLWARSSPDQATARQEAQAGVEPPAALRRVRPTGLLRAAQGRAEGPHLSRRLRAEQATASVISGLTCSSVVHEQGLPEAEI